MKNLALALATVIVLTVAIGFRNSVLAAMALWVAFELVKRARDLV